MLQNQDPTVSNIQEKRTFSDDHDLRRKSIQSILEITLLQIVLENQDSTETSKKKELLGEQTFTPFWITTLLHM